MLFSLIVSFSESIKNKKAYDSLEKQRQFAQFMSYSFLFFFHLVCACVSFHFNLHKMTMWTCVTNIHTQRERHILILLQTKIILNYTIIILVENICAVGSIFLLRTSELFVKWFKMGASTNTPTLLQTIRVKVVCSFYSCNDIKKALEHNHAKVIWYRREKVCCIRDVLCTH